MTAPFAASLCGYRLKEGKISVAKDGGQFPSTSDANDPGSIEWGRALFEHLGVPHDAVELPSIGDAVEQAARSELRGIRPDLDFGSGSAIDYEQYAHLRVFRDFSKAYKGPSGSLTATADDLRNRHTDIELRRFLAKVVRAEQAALADHALVQELRASTPDESLLKLDLTVSAPPTQGVRPRLLAGLSSKWSLRTDRAQDCISQGAKLVSLRRGRMPHYAVLTMEPRPAMLKLLAYGSGSVDCVYHLALPELRAAAASIEATKKRVPWQPRADLERMVAQGRLRDWDDLVTEVQAL